MSLADLVKSVKSSPNCLLSAGWCTYADHHSVIFGSLISDVNKLRNFLAVDYYSSVGDWLSFVL